MGERDFRTLGGPHVIRGVQQKISKNEKYFLPKCFGRHAGRVDSKEVVEDESGLQGKLWRSATLRDRRRTLLRF